MSTRVVVLKDINTLSPIWQLNHESITSYRDSPVHAHFRTRTAIKIQSKDYWTEAGAAIWRTSLRLVETLLSLLNLDRDQSSCATSVCKNFCLNDNYYCLNKNWIYPFVSNDNDIKNVNFRFMNLNPRGIIPICKKLIRYLDSP